MVSECLVPLTTLYIGQVDHILIHVLSLWERQMEYIPLREGEIIRITSYNVCYTKLLRSVNKRIEDFTVGKDREMDFFLAPFDIVGTMAHITMLQKVGLLEEEELQTLLVELKKLYKEAQSGNFKIEDGVITSYSIHYTKLYEMGNNPVF